MGVLIDQNYWKPHDYEQWRLQKRPCKDDDTMNSVKTKIQRSRGKSQWKKEWKEEKERDKEEKRKEIKKKRKEWKRKKEWNRVRERDRKAERKNRRQRFLTIPKHQWSGHRFQVGASLGRSWRGASEAFLPQPRTGWRSSFRSKAVARRYRDSKIQWVSLNRWFKCFVHVPRPFIANLSLQVSFRRRDFAVYRATRLIPHEFLHTFDTAAAAGRFEFIHTMLCWPWHLWFRCCLYRCC